MSGARRRAEEALARLDRWDAKYRPRTVEIDADDLRSLLSEEDQGASLRNAIEIEREGQRSMARALAEINRLSRLDVAIALAPAPSPAADEVREAAGCTGIAASWCPVHGDCSCPRDEYGERVDEEKERPGASHEDCPLHGRSSTHGDAEISALSARPAAAESDEVREAATRYATQPDRGNNGVPYCSEQCPQHDGKRCRILGGKPDGICEPEVLNLLAALDARGGAE